MVLRSASLLLFVAGTPGQSKIWVSELILIDGTRRKVPMAAWWLMADPVGCMCLRLSPRACSKCLALFVWVKRAHDVHGWLWVHAMRGLGTSSSDGEHDAWRAERGRTMCEATQSPQEVALGGMRRPRIPFQRFGARRGRSNIIIIIINACPSRYRAWRRF